MYIVIKIKKISFVILLINCLLTTAIRTYINSLQKWYCSNNIAAEDDVLIKPLCLACPNGAYCSDHGYIILLMNMVI